MLVECVLLRIEKKKNAKVKMELQFNGIKWVYDKVY